MGKKIIGGAGIAADQLTTAPGWHFLPPVVFRFHASRGATVV